MDKLSINEWAEEDRPREKLVALGAGSLSNAELLAILIGSGSAKESAVDLMKRIMHDCNDSLKTLGRMTTKELKAYHGMGDAKAITILAACELGKRRQGEELPERPVLDDALKIYNLMHPRMQDLDVEEAWVLLLNPRYQLISDYRLSHGGITETSVDVRVAMKEALLAGATAMALCHNHPSGNCYPSGFDNKITKEMQEACKTLRIHMVDHVIVTDGDYYSYNEEGKL